MQTRVTCFGNCDSEPGTVDAQVLRRVAEIKIGDSRRRPSDSQVFPRVSSIRNSDSGDNGVYAKASGVCAPLCRRGKKNANGGRGTG